MTASYRARAALTASLLLLAAPLAARADDSFKILVDTDSQYHHIVVTEDTEGYRRLSFERSRGNQSAVRLGHPEELFFPYARTSMVSFTFLPQAPKNALCIGLGGGSLPMFWRHYFPDMNIDIAEIDPEVVRVAQDYLEFKSDPAMTVANVDGRVFLRRTDHTYDFIMLDAFDSHSIPFHLTTREFLEIVKQHLRPGGIAIANIWSPEANKFHYAEIATYLAVFGPLYQFQAKGSGNYIFVALRDQQDHTADDLASRAKTIMDEKHLPFDLTPLVRDQFTVVTAPKESATILTDDHAPVDLLRSQKEKS